MRACERAELATLLCTREARPCDGARAGVNVPHLELVRAQEQQSVRAGSVMLTAHLFSAKTLAMRVLHIMAFHQAYSSYKLFLQGLVYNDFALSPALQ